MIKLKQFLNAIALHYDFVRVKIYTRDTNFQFVEIRFSAVIVRKVHCLQLLWFTVHRMCKLRVTRINLHGV